MPISKIAIGKLREATQPDGLRAAAAEFIATLIYIFAIEGCAIMFSHVITGQMLAAWTTTAISHAIGLIVGVSVVLNISGGHLNPAVTFGAFLGGHITFCRSILYWIAQLLGSVVGFVLLKLATGFVLTPYPPQLPAAIIFGVVLTFGLVFTYYALVFDNNGGNQGIIAPIVIGLAVGANLLSGGALFGTAMNPAASFGQAALSWTWTNHWVYWLGTFVGAGIAALVYEIIFVGKNTDHKQLPSADY